MRPDYKSTLRGLLALVAGALLPLAFAPFNVFPLGVLLPAVLFYLWPDDAPGRAAWHGFLFGLGMFGVGVSWVYVSMHDFGNMSAPLAGLAVLLFAAFLAGYPALAGYLQARFTRRLHPGWRLLAVFPGLWVLAEWLRGWLLTGFPWLDLGYSQVGAPLAGYAQWLGVYGVSLMCAVTAALAAYVARAPRRHWLPLVVAAVVVWVGGVFLGRVEWTQPEGKPLTVALVQGNVPLSLKWDASAATRIVQRYLKLSDEHRNADLVIWPEAAVPYFVDQLGPGFWHALAALSGKSHHVSVLFGALERRGIGRDAAYYNSAVAVGSGRSIYRKHHLVPFGEYPAFPFITRWLMQDLDIPMSDFSSWKGRQPPLKVAGQKLGVTICYEDAFPSQVIRELPAATLLVNISEDAWFGDSLGPLQRIQMARMRALETGRTMVRAANTGVSAVINPHGKITARTRQFITTVLVAKAQPMTGATPFVRIGNYGAVLLATVMLIVGFVGGRRKVASSE